MNLIKCCIYPCASILFKMRLDDSDVQWRYDVRTTTALVVVYVLCAFFKPFKLHIDRFFYKLCFPICVQKYLNSFLSNKAQNLIADLHLPLILTPKEHKTSIVYMSDVCHHYYVNSLCIEYLTFGQLILKAVQMGRDHS